MKNCEIGQMGFSPAEAAKIIGISRTQAYRLVELGEIRSTRIGERRIIVPKSEIERLLTING